MARRTNLAAVVLSAALACFPAIAYADEPAVDLPSEAVVTTDIAVDDSPADGEVVTVDGSPDEPAVVPESGTDEMGMPDDQSEGSVPGDGLACGDVVDNAECSTDEPQNVSDPMVIAPSPLYLQQTYCKVIGGDEVGGDGVVIVDPADVQPGWIIEGVTEESIASGARYACYTIIFAANHEPISAFLGGGGGAKTRGMRPRGNDVRKGGGATIVEASKDRRVRATSISDQSAAKQAPSSTTLASSTVPMQFRSIDRAVQTRALKRSSNGWIVGLAVLFAGALVIAIRTRRLVALNA